MSTPKTNPRLEGLDIARFAAFVGMVIVNFKIAMGAEGEDGILAQLTGLLEGRAAATFVVLAGLGLGLSAARDTSMQTLGVTLRRATFLLVIGLANMLVFAADILHYYAFYFLFGVLLLPLGTRALILVIVALNTAFIVMMFTLNYDAGWNWTTYDYEGFWTPVGFIRNLFFNGWHPVIPWLGFFVVGIVLARLSLGERSVQHRLIGLGILAILLAEGLARLTYLGVSSDPELALLATTSPVPPMPFYTLAGIGISSTVIGVCLRFSNVFRALGLLALLTPAGRQTLTLYIAHILIGMGTLEALGMLSNQSLNTAVIASLFFCALTIVYANLWARYFKRGPIEALMRRVAG